MSLEDIAIIPMPQSVNQTGGRFVLASGSAIRAEGPGARSVGELLAGYLRPATGYALPVGSEGAIALIAEGEAVCDDAGFADESYRLTVAAESVELRAKAAPGLARGVQTLRQLFPAEMFESGETAEQVVARRGLRQVSDADVISGLVRQVLEQNPDAVATYLQGKAATARWLFGQVMRAAGGQANPQVVQSELQRQLEQLNERQ